jgi:hypothetical protein
VLPVSESVVAPLPEDAAGAAEAEAELLDDAVEPELPQAASSASGASAAAAHTVRNRMDTKEFPFSPARSHVRCSDSHVCACD